LFGAEIDVMSNARGLRPARASEQH
jgi:hypothetical protein